MSPVRRAAHNDVAPLAGVLARAFIDDPVVDFIFEDARRRRRQLESFFSLQLRHAYLPRGEVYTTSALEGAALWIPPGAPKLDWLDSLAHMRLVPMLRSRYFVMRTVARHLAVQHPRERHYYLGTIGIDPPHRRLGIGSLLMAPVLERCDRERILCYLECSRKANIAFYESHGFVVVEETQLPLGGPLLWPMRRKPPRR